jgi:agmatine deiminase
MPAEWGPHERTLVAWPTRADTWRGTGLEAGRRCHAEVVDAISQFEPVTLVADPADVDEARRSCTAEGVEVLSLPIDDSWIRDSGPIVVRAPDGERAGVDFDFNGWGGKFAPFDKDREISRLLLDHLGIERRAASLVLEGGSITVDGEGLLVTTEQCLLDESRNPDMPRGDIERALLDLLGLERIVWLEQGLLEDADTDGHVDNICAFIGPGRALLQAVPATDPNRANMERNREILEREGVEVETLDLLPRTERPGSGEAIVIPYLNLYFVNGAVIVPVAGLDPDMDSEALERIGELIPDREIVGVEAITLAFGGGGIHCITQQVPQA